MSDPSRPRVRVILNPSAAAGSALGRVSEIGETLRRYDLPHEIVLTRARGHAKELAQAAAADGVDVIAVVGGDGTLNEVAQAYLGDSGEAIRGPDLALIPSGTGGDFKKTLGMSGAIDEAVARIRHGQRRSIDLGVLRMIATNGEEKLHAFVNIASFGIGGQVDSIVNGSPKWLGGKVAFFAATLRAMASYKNASVRVKVDGKPWFEGPIFNVAIANGRFFGGGMMIAPHADPSDGRFECVAIGDLTRPEVVALSSKIYKGAHLASRDVRVTSGTRVEAEPLHPWASVLLDVDGEQPGRLPAKATLLKGALTFRA
ncbi:MAG: diacylglycerol/lipid kinase family protein [Polyangiaceae bacterium]